MKLDFSFDTQYGKFSDSLVLPDDRTLSEAEIEAMKQQRLDNWIAVVSYVPTEEEIAQMEAEAAKMLAQMEAEALEQPPEE
jgi:hypothetical protein